MKIQVMLDLETLGTGPGAVIVAIGAVKFNPANMELGEEFYQVIDMVDAQRAGLTIDAGTVKWWLERNEPARGGICQGGTELITALTQFRNWLLPDEAEVWGNGASFDNPILVAAYRAIHEEAPWKLWNDRCYRTMKALAPQVKMARTGTHHNALDDARSQAVHLMDILYALQIKL